MELANIDAVEVAGDWAQRAGYEKKMGLLRQSGEGLDGTETGSHLFWRRRLAGRFIGSLGWYFSFTGQ